MCYVFLLFVSNQIRQPVQAHTQGVVSLTPQATSISCIAAGQLDAPLTYFPVPTWMIAHALLGAIGFGFLMPIGTFFPASLKMRGIKGNVWFKAHYITMGVAVLMGWAAFILGAVSVTVFLSSNHGKMGLAIFCMSIAQVLLGKFRPHLPHAGDDVKSTKRRAFEWVHPILGWSIVGCISIQVYWGYGLLQLYWPAPELEGWKWAHVTGLFPLWFVIMIFLHPPGFSRSRANQSSAKQVDTVASHA
jgi:hypothetical protein